jgi:hypothetical protein
MNPPKQAQDEELFVPEAGDYLLSPLVSMSEIC